MPTPYIVSSSTPIQATQNGYPAPVTIYNSSKTATINCAESGNMASAFPLNPGSTLVWDAGKALYLALGSGAGPVTVFLNENGGSLTDATAIASAIIQQGLADDIAAKIAISGAPSIDASRIPIYSATKNVLTAGNTWFPNTPPGLGLDVSAYNSVRIVIQCATPSGPAFTNLQPAVTACAIWDNNSPEAALDSWGVIDNNNNGGPYSTEFWVPCRTNTLSVVIANTRASTEVATVNIYGSYQTITDPRYSCNTSGWPYYVNGSNSVNNTPFEYSTGCGYGDFSPKTTGEVGLIPCRLGNNIQVIATVTGVTTAGAIRISPSNTTGKDMLLFPIPVAAGTVSYQTPIIPIPYAPIRVGFTSPLISSGIVGLSYNSFVS